MSSLQIEMFPCLSNNYGFLLHDAGAGTSSTGFRTTAPGSSVTRCLRWVAAGCSRVPRNRCGARCKRSRRRTLGLEHGEDVAVFARTRALKDAF
jgi:hypothetical protein